jgi:hypothetical protein
MRLARHAGGLTAMQAVFVEAFIRCRNGTQAALEAGASPANAARQANNWLNEPRFEAGQRAIAQRLALISQTTDLKASQILKFLGTVLYYQPAQFFQPDRDGAWSISEERLRDLPPEIGCLIESIERDEREVYDKDGNLVSRRTKFRVRLVSKATALEIAARHQLGQKVDVHPAPIDPASLDWTAIAEMRRRVVLNLPPPAGPGEAPTSSGGPTNDHLLPG